MEGQQAIGTLPLNQNLKIAIVGMGAAGIAALYELSKLEGNHSVTVFEPDAKHVVHHQNPRDIDIEGLRAGRVSAARAKSEQGEDQTVYEIGAMRFPEIAGLTWQYAQDVFGSDGKVKVFPIQARWPPNSYSVIRSSVTRAKLGPIQTLRPGRSGSGDSLSVGQWCRTLIVDR